MASATFTIFWIVFMCLSAFFGMAEDAKDAWGLAVISSFFASIAGYYLPH